MINHALEYLDMGFSVIPVKMSDKKPYIKWAKYQTQLPTEDEVERWWTQWPNANIAIVTGSVSGIYVIDADSPAGIEWINTNIPKTGVYSLTGKGVHAVFKVPDGIRIQNQVRDDGPYSLGPEVDVRGEGGYVVAPPSVHENGHKYKWQFIMDGWDDVAEFEPQKKTNLNLDLSGIQIVKNIHEEVESGVPEGNRDNMLYKEACRLRGKNLSYDEAILIITNYAKRCSPPFPEKEAIKKLDQAWKYDPGETVHTELSNHDCEIETCDDTEKIIPEKLLNPGGLLSDIIECIGQNSAVSVPFFSLASAISLVGNVAGMKVCTQTGLRTNFYIVVLGYSGTGKNAPFDCLGQILFNSDAAHTQVVTELTSSSAILKSLSNPGKEISLMMLDELGLVMKGLKNPNSSAGDIPRLLIKLFSSQVVECKNYADGREIVIPWQHLSFFGASTPERFWESLSPGEVTDGFLARMLLFESHHDALLPKMGTFLGGYDHVIVKINKIMTIHTRYDNESPTALIKKPIPNIIVMDREAEKKFNDWRLGYHEIRNRFKGDPNGLYSIYGRVAEHGAKLALIHAVSDDLDDIRVIKSNSVEWACGLMDYLTDHLTSQIGENIAETDIQRYKQRIIKWIRSTDAYKNGSGVTLRDIQRGPCNGLLKSVIEKILESMVLGEQLIAVDDTSNKQAKVSYLIVKRRRKTKKDKN